MKNEKPLTIALDVDDVLMPCLEPAALKANINPMRITNWDLYQTDLSESEICSLLGIVNDPKFIMEQVPYYEADTFVSKILDRGHSVIIASAVPPEMMTTRAMKILRDFPMLEMKNIMLGARKDLLSVDLLVDDNPKNLGGQAKHSLLMKKPYNANVKGFPICINYEEILAYIDCFICP